MMTVMVIIKTNTNMLQTAKIRVDDFNKIIICE